MRPCSRICTDFGVDVFQQPWRARWQGLAGGADGIEQAGDLDFGFLDLGGRVGTAHQGGAHPHGGLAVAADLDGADEDGRVQRGLARRIAADQGDGGAVIGARLGLVARHHAKRAQHRAAGDGGRIHRAAQQFDHAFIRICRSTGIRYGSAAPFP